MTPKRETRIYFAPFHATSDDSSATSCGSRFAAFKKAVQLKDWPYDNGDDPSFYAAHKLGGQLSWGICRQDVRNGLRPGDIVVFFSFRKFKETGDSEYRLCAIATVDRNVSHIDLWQHKSLQIYRKYFNLLIRPLRSARDVWEHFEPTLEGSRVHRDWLWRMTEHEGFRKNDFKQLEKTDRLELDAIIRGRPVVIAKNYVLFSQDPAQSRVLSKPPIVAWHAKGKPVEGWNRDKFSQAVRLLTLDVAQRMNRRRRWLRIRNSQRAHRHVVFELDVAEANRLARRVLRSDSGPLTSWQTIAQAILRILALAISPQGRGADLTSIAQGHAPLLVNALMSAKRS